MCMCMGMCMCMCGRSTLKNSICTKKRQIEPYTCTAPLEPYTSPLHLVYSSSTASLEPSTAPVEPYKPIQLI